MKRLILFSLVSLTASVQAESDFRAQKSMLEASERVLNQEQNPQKRLQLLLRWIKIKEEYDKTQIFESELSKAAELQKSKNEIIERLEVELHRLLKSENLDLESIYRELAFRYLEMREFQKASDAFQNISKKTANDQLAHGDAFVQLNFNQKALEAYQIASKDPMLASVAAYKKAWVLMRENQFDEALREFDDCILDDQSTHMVLKEEAYKDRIRPFIESFSKENFDREDVEALRQLSTSVSQNKKTQKKVFEEALKSLIQGFTSKSQIDLAQQIFDFLSLEIADTQETLVFAAPTWIKVYRSRLEHDSVERILGSLPQKPIEIKSSNNLRAELNNSAQFYETLLEDEAQKARRPILLLTYERYFQLYPLDLEANSLRINYSRLLLQNLNAKKCIEILKDRKKPLEQNTSDPIENLALSLEGKCILKYLDQLYALNHSEEFYRLIQSALLDNQVYLYPNLGIKPEDAFQALSRMLIGAIQKNPTEMNLRSSLIKLNENFPFESLLDLKTELRIISAELAFQDLTNAKEEDETKSNQFFDIFKQSPVESAVAVKSITNSVLMTNLEPGLERCERFQKTYAKDFKPGTSVFDHCIKLAEDFLTIEREYQFWKPHEKNLNEAQNIRLGLLELALEKSAGRARIEKLKTKTSKNVLENWDGFWPKPNLKDKKWNKLEARILKFMKALKPIKFSQIEDLVPAKISTFNKLEASLIRYSEKQKNPFFQAKTLSLRAELSSRFAKWLQGLPEPKDMSEEELLTYREKSTEFLSSWNQKAESHRNECSQIAHSLSPFFHAPDSKFCREDTKEEIYQDFLSSWRKSLNKTGNIQRQLFNVFYRADQSAASDPLKARYYLFRALELSKNDVERGQVFLSLAKLTEKERFWRQAAALDGSLIEPIQWQKEAAKGNPFFENLYDRQIRILRRIRDQQN